MFICKYCGTEFTEHRSNCTNCGAPIKASETAKKDSLDSIRKICLKYEGVSNLHLDETIDAKRMKTVRDEFSIAANENLFMVYDDTLFGNNKLGFAICQDGLYWKNDWSVDTKRNFLTWQDFAEREIKLDGLHITLGRGDAIGTAGVGADEAREQFVKMLNEIKGLISS